MENKRFLKKFTSQSDYDSQKDSVMGIPHVVLLEDTNEMLYASENNNEEIDYSKEFFTIEALEEGFFEINANADNFEDEVPTSFKYRLNGGEWVEILDNISLSLIAYDKIQISCVSSSVNTFSPLFSSNISFNAYGNTMSLLYGDDFIDKIEIFPYCLHGLFQETKITSAENLILPATVLMAECYFDMFYNCTSLTTSPELPATTLDWGCYSEMFYGCISLTTAPELLATTLVGNCYGYMFYGCSNLNYIKMLATSIDKPSLDTWVHNVPSTGTFVKKKGVEIPSGESGIPNGWTVENA